MRGRSFVKHSALRAAVHKDLVNPGEWTVELGKDYDLVISLRQTGDYAVEAAQRIIAACQEGPSSLD